jgi:hypothetical protein
MPISYSADTADRTTHSLGIPSHSMATAEAGPNPIDLHLGLFACERLVVLLSIRFSPSYHEVAENFKYSEEFLYTESIGSGHFSEVLCRARCDRSL